MENPELELARRFVERTATSVFLTGKAGTGKTTFLRELRARSPKRMIVLAPTGVAAINAGGVTIHSFFQLAFAPYVPESERGIAPDRPREAVRFSRQKIAIIKSIDLLVIDEISMVRADVLDAVSDVLRRFRDREQDPAKQWKITDEDWRNREKWELYEQAVDEMMVRTSTVNAPWVIVEGNDKLYARIKVLETVVDALEKRLHHNE